MAINANPHEHSGRALTENECAWITFLRLASRDSDPAPTLKRVQALRQMFELETR
mgnify:CR=1 FL=1